MLIAAHASNERDCRIGRGLRLRICELFRQTSGLSRCRDRDIPIGQPRRHVRIEHERPWQMPKTSFVTQGLYCGSQKVDPEIESPHDERRRPSVSLPGIAMALIRRRPQARQYFRCMAVWISVGVDCEYTRIGRVGPAQSMRCIDQEPPRGWARVHPPRARCNQPEEIDVQLVITGPAGLLGRGDQRRESCRIAKRSSRNHLFNPRDPGPLERSWIEPLDLAQDWSDHLWSPELTGQCGRAEQAAAAVAGPLSSPARLSAVTATPIAPRCPARLAASSSSRATSSCSPEISAARCQTRRSGWSSKISASAPCSATPFQFSSHSPASVTMHWGMPEHGRSGHSCGCGCFG